MTMQDRFPRLFTPQEANALLPDLQPEVRRMLDGRDQIIQYRPDLEPTLDKAIGNGHNDLTPEVMEAFEQVRQAVEAIQGHGVLVKDVNTGLLDFPSEREGDVIFLCWRHGEPRVEHWHDVDDGYAGRQPL
ncbi:MAG: DUF2203 domain-containing protein [Anaerolineales bacterium]|nr:DUF2203 domain-containing protein [Anaerolineales bacterium]